MHSTDKPSALVVGGSRGIGRAIALKLAREGHPTLVLGRDAGRLSSLAEDATSEGLRVHAVSADITDSTSMLQALDAGLKASGFAEPTIFVHAAAAIYRHQRLQFVEPLEIDRLLDTDLRSAIHLTRWVLPAMAAARFGRVIYLGSLAAQQGLAGANVYAASKAGLEGLARGVALDYGRRGITANTLSIGVVASERMLERTQGTNEKQERILANMATGRFTELSEVAETVAFLCSEHARSITGSVIQLSGGAHLNTNM